MNATDLDTLLDKLRKAAAEHAADDVPDRVQVNRWPRGELTGAASTLCEAWATTRPRGLAHFLVPNDEDFLELAFRSCLGRPADPGGRSHYRGKLQQRTPRLEVLAQLSASAEASTFGGAPRLPLWVRPMLRGIGFPASFVRRGSRALLRRVESRLAVRARRGPVASIWRLADAIDQRDRLRQADNAAVRLDLTASSERLLAAEDRLTTGEAGLSRLGAALAATRARIAALDYASPRSSAPAASTVDSAVAPEPARDDELTRYYLTLEAVFRGDPERIRAQLASDYLAVVVKAKDEAGEGPCLDLGCGRGEWLDVLAAHGFAAKGVDLNPAMAGEARSRGHDVTVGDALAFLRGLPDDSVLAVSAFHLVEHLGFPTLFRVIAECRRVLKPRGLLILETPNPENIWVATHTFHHDPTHGNPLTPASLEFLVNHHGLETIAVPRLHPYPEDARLPGNDPVTERLNAMTCGGQDFAVIARKTPIA
jgi:O-antigen chain-terminating methyltransferase